MNKKKFILHIKAIKDYAIPLIGVVFAILNIYLSTKLNPVLSDIKDIVHRVDAVDMRVTRVEKDCREVKLEILDELKYLRTRIDNVYQVAR